MEWIKEIEFKDLLDKDTQLIYDHCGIEILMSLWQNLPGLELYLSEKNLFRLKERYIRKKYNESKKENKPFDKKRIAAYLQVSEKFVYNALAATDEKDDRQQKLI